MRKLFTKRFGRFFAGGIGADRRMRWAASEAQMEPSWDRVLCFAAGKSRGTGKTVVMPDIKRSGFLQLICATPDSPFRSLIQSE